MTRLLEILISFAIVAVLFLAVGLALPSSRHLSHSVETNRKLTIVYDTLNSFRRFTQWNALALRDPTADFTLSGPAEGVGATLNIKSGERDVGDGYWKIVESEPNKRVAYEIQNDQPGHDKRTAFTLKRVGRAGRNVEITQTYDVDYGWNIVGRFYGLYVRSGFGEDMKMSLARLTNMLASVPNIDYTEIQRDYKVPATTVVDRPGETLLVVSASVPMDRDKVKSQMRGNHEWINKVIAANGLEAAGPVRIITNEQGSQTYGFDLAVPVRKPGATNNARIEGITVPAGAPVKVEYVEPAKAVTTRFKGDMGNLQKLRDSLRAWALTHGYETVDRPYENWIGGIDAGFTDQGEYQVLWALK